MSQPRRSARSRRHLSGAATERAFGRILAAMARVDRHVPGSFSWFELATTDCLGAKAFYADLFGWTADEQPLGPSGTYTMFRLGGRDAAGAYALNDEMLARGVPPHWELYILVDSADEAAARVADLGGSVIASPFDVMDIGRMAVFHDPTGAVFAVWEARRHGGTGVAGEPGTMTWGELQTRDRAAAVAFYQELFGWRMAAGKNMQEAGDEDYVHIMNGDEMIGGMPPASHLDPGSPPSWLLYFETTDCAAAADAAAGMGGRVLSGPMRIGNEGTIAVVADPQGAVFALHETPEAA